MRNHNNLLGQVRGVDGIKTGYTEASGYNLTSSVRRDEKHIVAVVLGGTSNGARDARMRQLIEAHILQASTQRTAPIVVEANGQDGAHQDNARQDGAHVVAVAPATANVEPPADERSDAAVASAKADPVPVPRPRLQAARVPARASKRGKHPGARNSCAADNGQSIDLGRAPRHLRSASNASRRTQSRGVCSPAMSPHSSDVASAGSAPMQSTFGSPTLLP